MKKRVRRHHGFKSNRVLEVKTTNRDKAIFIRHKNDETKKPVISMISLVLHYLKTLTKAVKQKNTDKKEKVYNFVNN